MRDIELNREIKQQVYKNHTIGFLTWREMMCDISIEESRLTIEELVETMEKGAYAGY